ncbi:energy transducer TonB, partial [bacterium]|nr:energy transducer TonB [bacterium]
EKKGDLDESAVSATPRSAQGLLPPKQHTGNIIPPAALFDRNIIHKYAAREDPDKQDLSFTAPGFKNRGYMRMLKEKIERIWRYPNEAARSGISGDLYIKFTINKKGQIRDITLLRTSGFNVLDFAAMQALKDAEPYWPLPADWKDDTLEITGHFVYVYGR